MAVLLENQAKELLREASAMAAGDVEGFAAVAFPIVRHVFGGLIANDLVSVQLNELAIGTDLFLDFVKSPDARGDESSVYGGNVVGSQLTGGVDLGQGSNGLDAGGFYDFNTGYAHATASVIANIQAVGITGPAGLATINANGQQAISTLTAQTATGEDFRKIIDFDPDVLELPADGHILAIDVLASDLAGLNRRALSAVRLRTSDADLTAAQRTALNGLGGGANIGNVAAPTAADRHILIAYMAMELRIESVNTIDGAAVDDFLPGTARQVRRLTRLVTLADGTEVVRVFIVDPNNTAIVKLAGGAGAVAASDGLVLDYPKADQLAAVQNGVGAVNLLGAAAGAPDLQDMPLERAADMAEIDTKVDSIPVTAQTKKLKAKWSSRARTGLERIPQP